MVITKDFLLKTMKNTWHFKISKNKIAILKSNNYNRKIKINDNDPKVVILIVKVN